MRIPLLFQLNTAGGRRKVFILRNTPGHKRKKGSIMVDAAICIPLFIIAMAMMLQVINFIGMEESKYFQAEKRIQAVGSFGSEIELGTTVNDAAKALSIDHVQSYPIVYQISFPFSGAFIKSRQVIMDMPYRTYIGESVDLYDGDFVYIFPKNEGSEKSGPKYHDKYCRTMKGGATKGLDVERVRKQDAVSRGYSRCQWCMKDGLK